MQTIYCPATYEDYVVWCALHDVRAISRSAWEHLQAPTF